jgi:hypothetical protein
MRRVDRTENLLPGKLGMRAELKRKQDEGEFSRPPYLARQMYSAFPARREQEGWAKPSEMRIANRDKRPSIAERVLPY